MKKKRLRLILVAYDEQFGYITILRKRNKYEVMTRVKGYFCEDEIQRADSEIAGVWDMIENKFGQEVREFIAFHAKNIKKISTKKNRITSTVTVTYALLCGNSRFFHDLLPIEVTECYVVVPSTFVYNVMQIIEDPVDFGDIMSSFVRILPDKPA